MRHRITWFLPLAAIVVLTACRKDAAEPDPGPAPQHLEAETFFNVPYGSNPQQVYDLYLPEGRSAATTKVIVLVHGGGWVGGDKDEMDALADYLQQRHPHHAIANMNYVLAEEGTKAFPDQLYDLAAVLDQLGAQAQQLQIKPQFALVGASAGAHLAMLYDYVYDATDRVKMVADVVGPTDFTDPFYADNPLLAGAIDILTDADAYPPGTDLAVALSPAHQVTSASSPTILLYGASDDLVPVSNAYSLDSALYAHDIPHALTIYSGGHGNWPDTDLLDAMTRISTYVDQYLPVE